MNQSRKSSHRAFSRISNTWKNNTHFHCHYDFPAELTIQRLGSVENLEETLKDLATNGSVPPKSVFVNLVRLLVHDDFDIREAVGQYFEDIACTRRRSVWH